MYVPFISQPPRKIYRRKGGGKNSSSRGTRKTSTSSSGSRSSGSTRTQSISTSGTSKQATSYGKGGGAVSTIPSGQLFAGRTQGGGTRDQVVGTRTYGSGYPGITSRGVAGLGFPFYYWPIAWGGIGLGSAAYLHDSEYGRPDNSSRPGGAMTYATFPASSGNATFHVVADNDTVASLITDVNSNCSSVINTTSTSSTPITFNDSDASTPKPEQSVQYYRASTVALTVDGYNNTGALENDTADTPIPSWVDTNTLNCLNLTIEAAVPLVDGAGRQWVAPNVGFVTLLWIVYHLCSFF
ncbi:uncharacterized protein BT62DRAFT_982442 [Guyanagaster necrorhizus]|uniref:Uncharacterized protein n=1 Tax=Guyanagaster necrorhizus TaxID=856835 RepID=A0A9P7VL86_9AGAR|nr:uncharacterized protein BT62DRAFT_982442 [Guyanagaster necrorhizus MCA 3950]KAG7442542.1 hypothetical protein BT62DRAFT_982442 [Guyanagaster necrorhizus MCA 3950]